MIQIKRAVKRKDKVPSVENIPGLEIIKENSTQHENLNAHKYKSIMKFGIFQAHISLDFNFFCT